MIQYESELLHHGVKGMKWGVRRYQNADGTLTSQGKKYYDSYKTYSKLEDKYKKLKRKSFDNPNSTKAYLNAHHAAQKAESYRRGNKKSVNLGRKLAAKSGDTGAKVELSDKRKVAAGIGLMAASAVALGIGNKYKNGTRSILLLGKKGKQISNEYGGIKLANMKRSYISYGASILAAAGMLGVSKTLSTNNDRKMDVSKSDSSVTKRVKNDWNNMDDIQFKRKYQTTKRTYAKRVKRYGDPYMNAPLAKLGKKLQARNKKK